MSFVQNVNFEAITGRTITRRLPAVRGISSIPRLVAASISMTSTALPARISVHDSHTPQGSATGLSEDRQFRAAARMRATVVLPDAPMSAENVAVSGAGLFQCIL